MAISNVDNYLLIVHAYSETIVLSGCYQVSRLRYLNEECDVCNIYA